MQCEEVRASFSPYLDDLVSLPLRAVIDGHLHECPVCRAHVVELRQIRSGLRNLSQPVPPVGLQASIIEALEIEAAARRLHPRLSLSQRTARWLEPKLMPYTVGSFASLILFAAMFMALRPHFVALREAAMRPGLVYAVTIERGPHLDEPVN